MDGLSISQVAERSGFPASTLRYCCRFFTFSLTVGGGNVTLDVTGPADARPIIGRARRDRAETARPRSR